MKKLILLFPLALSVLTAAKAQSVVPATLNALGGTTTIGTNEFEWSVGEMVLVSTFTAGGTTLTQGILQPFDGSREGIETSELLKQLLVFPNPATTVVNITYTATTNGTLSYRLMDVTGKMLLADTYKMNMQTLTTQVDITNLANAVYVLEVSIASEKGTTKSSYKIEKLN